MNNHLKTILKVCVFALAIVGVILFCTAPFYYNQDKPVLNAVSVYPADTVSTDYTFVSSAFVVPIFVTTDQYYSDNVTSGYKPFLMTFHFNYIHYVDNSWSLGVLFDSFDGYVNSTNNPNNDVRIYSYFGGASSFNLTNSSPTIDEGSRNIINTPYNFFFNYGVSGTFSTIDSINLSIINSAYGSYTACVFSLVSPNGILEIQFLSWPPNEIREYDFTSFYFSNNRIIQLNDFTDNEIYNIGYDYGYRDGYSVGKSDGYESGYNVGYSNGYSVGYSDGIDDSNVYTFGNLLTAVVDVPVSVFISMLDFNIMGFNLLSLVVGLLTLAIICLVVKLLLGGK